MLLRLQGCITKCRCWIFKAEEKIAMQALCLRKKSCHQPFSCPPTRICWIRLAPPPEAQKNPRETRELRWITAAAVKKIFLDAWFPGKRHIRKAVCSNLHPPLYANKTAPITSHHLYLLKSIYNISKKKHGLPLKGSNLAFIMSHFFRSLWLLGPPNPSWKAPFLLGLPQWTSHFLSNDDPRRSKDVWGKQSFRGPKLCRTS